MYKNNFNSIQYLFLWKFIIFIIIFHSINVHADDFTGLKDGDFLQKSAISKDRVLIRDKNFKTKGYLQPSIINPRKTVLYDTDGKPQGYFEKDVLDSRKTRFHQTKESKKDSNLKIDYNKSYFQRSVIDSRKTVLYDSDGNPKGYFRKDVLNLRKFRFHQKK